MGMYALGLMLLLTSIISGNTGNLIHVAFADDLTGMGKTQKLIEWLKNVLHYGSYLGYYVNESKSWLIIKEEYIEIANETFRDYNIKITSDGHRNLVADFGSSEKEEEFVSVRMGKRTSEILTHFACTEPHTAFSGLFMD